MTKAKFLRYARAAVSAEDASLMSLPLSPSDLARQASAAFGRSGVGSSGTGAPVARMTPLGDVNVELPRAAQPSTVLLELQRPAGPIERIRALAQPMGVPGTDRIYRATPPSSWLSSGGAVLPLALYGGEEVRGAPLPLVAAPPVIATKPPVPPHAALPSRVAEGDHVPSRFAPKLQFLARVRVQLKQPITIGETPEGLRIDFVVHYGTARGDSFNADVLENTVDYMLVRADGIGLINVHA